MARTTPVKPEEEFARSYADRLILEKLSDMDAAVKLSELADRLSDAGLGLAAVRSLLASNPERFAYHERKWIPAARLQSQGRPYAEVIAIILHRFGGPMAISLLVGEVARVRRSAPAEIESTVRRILNNDSSFVITPRDEAVLATLGFRAYDEPTDRALALNEVTREEMDAVVQKIRGVDLRAEDAVAQALQAAAPVRLKALGAAVWTILRGDDPRSIIVYDDREFLAQVMTTPGFVYAPDGTIHPEADAKKWISAAIRLADRLAPTVEMEDAAPIEVKPEDVDKLVAKILASDASVTATRLLEENYEITPSNKTFPDDLANVIGALRGNAQVLWVGGDRFRKMGDAPDYVHEVPEPFHFEVSQVQNEEGELVDVELTDEGLSSTLRRLLQHPLAMDVMDEELQPAQKAMPDSVRLVLKSIHRELGTFPLSQFPTGWFESEPDLQELIIVDPNGRELQVWLSHEARLTYNWFDWWYEQPVESGAVFSLTKTNRPNVLDFTWQDQPDPVVYISSQRMEELRTLGTEYADRSTLDILVAVMGHWPKGADYLTLLAEVNVARRTSRRLVASLLSSYQAFYQRSGSPVWHFDPKKLDLGFDKTKRKFVRK